MPMPTYPPLFTTNKVEVAVNDDDAMANRVLAVSP